MGLSIRLGRDPFWAHDLSPGELALVLAHLRLSDVEKAGARAQAPPRRARQTPEQRRASTEVSSWMASMRRRHATR